MKPEIHAIVAAVNELTRQMAVDAERIEKLEEENGVLFAANVRLNSRADLDCDHYRDRIEKLEAALREIIQEDALNGKTVFVGDFGKIACKALEGKDD